MTYGTQAHTLVRYIAGDPEKPVKAAINRVVARIAPYLKLSPSRVEDIWYGEARLIRAEEIDALRDAAEEQRRKIEAGHAAAAKLADFYYGVAERLRQDDENLYCFEIDRLERLAGEICPRDRPGAAPGSVKPPSSTNGGRE